MKLLNSACSNPSPLFSRGMDCEIIKQLLYLRAFSADPEFPSSSRRDLPRSVCVCVHCLCSISPRPRPCPRTAPAAAAAWLRNPRAIGKRLSEATSGIHVTFTPENAIPAHSGEPIIVTKFRFRANTTAIIHTYLFEEITDPNWLIISKKT